MEAISFVVPEWMSWISVPILIACLLVLDYCAAIWLQPTHVQSIQTGADATTKEIFRILIGFSLVGTFFGAIMSMTDASFGSAILVALLILGCLVWAFSLPKKLWLVTGVNYGVAFLIGEMVVEYNAVFAGIIMIVSIITLLILIITLGPLSSIYKR